ncbi:unnamed protein product [Diplocarpon coronariae]|uniref:DUF7357 domain-containing protein n=1 Tax=Diplocarpon coronariae TaxID=2795749 RepID=A0A218YV09_9HELO|nr:hypothetical protein B2J93_4129 [Marssonina coronariae]
MRIRVTVRRHGLPDTPIIWSIDTNASPTVYQLLEQINDIVPIETDGQWGLEDYAVELKGVNGTNYECLHFQPVTSVIKEEDEVIIRPLLTQDLRVRRISGRHQISDDGKRLYDGLALGRPFLRVPASRPAVNIPPRKKRRVAYNDDEDDDKAFAPLMEAEDPDSEEPQQTITEADLDEDDSEDDDDFAPGEDSDASEEDSNSIEEDHNQQRVVCTDSEDTGSKEDEDFAPEGKYVDEDDKSKQLVVHVGFDNAGSQSDQTGTSAREGEGSDTQIVTTEIESLPASAVEPDNIDNLDEPALVGIADANTRKKIRKLHSAFPDAHLAVCKYILQGKGVDGDMGEAYEVLARGFFPTKPKIEITETREDQNELPVRKGRSNRRSKSKSGPPTVGPESLESIDVDAHDSLNPVIEHYDQNGLPPGSIGSGNALSFMAEVAASSPGPRPSLRGSTLPPNGRSIKFAEEDLPHGLTSTPCIDREPRESNSSEDDSDSSDDSSNEDDSSSSDDSGSSSDDADEEMADAVENRSSSEGSSDSSSDSSSEDESPEQESSKPPPKTRLRVQEGQGKNATHRRNTRRRNMNILKRYKEKGILPAGTTLAELSKLKHLNAETSSEDAHAALEKLRAQQMSAEADGESEKASSGAADIKHNATREEFELRRRALLASLSNGGVEVGSESAKKQRKSPKPVQMPIAATESPLDPVRGAIEVQQAKLSISAGLDNSNSTVVSKDIQSFTSNLTDNKAPEAEKTRPTAPGAPPDTDMPIQRPKPQPATTSSSQTTLRRPKFDLGAGRRMLFGALGFKAPKTKKDEEKLKQDLMKDVKPLTTPKLVEEPGEIEDVVQDEDPEAWRMKISYRAVECVQEDVELSEPPFPFVQRWDPRQRWTQKGKRKGNQRDDAQYHYEDNRASKKQKNRKGKNSSAEEQEYLEASYESSYQEEGCMASQFDESMPAQDPHFNVDQDFSQQFMNDVQSDADITPASDLVQLPEDLSSLPCLHDGEAKVGMIVAFKTLEFSAATQWQPQVSPYMTATITEISDEGELTLTLALRDRKQSTKNFDPQTGERIYSGFEAPDDEEDNEALYRFFTDLQEPKIVLGPAIMLENDLRNKIQGNVEHDVISKPSLAKATKVDFVKESQAKERQNTQESTDIEDEKIKPDAQSSHELPEAQFSHVTETQLNSDTPESYQQERQPDDLVQGSQFEEAPPEVSVIQYLEVREPYIKDPTLEYTEQEESPREEPVTQESNLDGAVFDPVTSTVGYADELPNNSDLKEPTEEARQRVGRMMKDAGFRSSVPSSSLWDIRPDGIQSPGEVALFEKLRGEMIDDNWENERENTSQPSSPKFNGLESSPASEPLELSRTPIKARQAPVISSPNRPPSSSWETVDQDYQSSPPPQRGPSPPPPNMEEPSGWVTIIETKTVTQVQRSSPPLLPVRSNPPLTEPARNLGPAVEPTRPASSAPKLARKVSLLAGGPARVSSPSALEQSGKAPTLAAKRETKICEIEEPRLTRKATVGRAQAYLEQLQPRKRRRSNDSDATSTPSNPKSSPERLCGLDVENKSDASLQYPTLPENSSFTSQVTDHGRQPDFIFDDSVAENMEPPMIPDIDVGTPQPDHETAFDSWKTKVKADSVKHGKSEVKLPPKNLPFERVIHASSSSDSDKYDLPSLQELSQRSTTIERENSGLCKLKKPNKSDTEYKDAIVALQKEMSEDRITPKAPQPRRGSTALSTKSRGLKGRYPKRPAPQTSKQKDTGRIAYDTTKGRTLERPASQSHSSVPRASRSQASSQNKIPPGSQIFDLTLSSDVESKANIPDTHSKLLRTYNLDSDDNDASPSPGPGWVAKRTSTIKGVKPRKRKTSLGLRNSS